LDLIMLWAYFLNFTKSKWQTIGEPILFHMAYILGSCQITRFPKWILANSWRCSPISSRTLKSMNHVYWLFYSFPNLFLWDSLELEPNPLEPTYLMLLDDPARALLDEELSHYLHGGPV
jgi:hypothetical protein